MNISQKNTTAQDDQEDETEQSLSESLQTRRQLVRIHENMGAPIKSQLVFWNFCGMGPDLK